MWSLGLAVDAETGEASFVDEIEHTDELGGTRPGLSSFARDMAGELYVVTQGGEVFRLGLAIADVAAGQPGPPRD